MSSSFSKVDYAYIGAVVLAVVSASVLFLSKKKSPNAQNAAHVVHISPVGSSQFQPSVMLGQKSLSPNVDIATRNARIRDVVFNEYATVLEGLVSDSALRRKLLGLLAERTIIVYDAKEVFIDLHSRGKAPSDYRIVVKQSQSVIDEEIRQLIGANISANILALADTPEFVRELNRIYSPALAQFNVPLNPDQTAFLALMMLSTYGSPNNPALVINQDNYNPASGLRHLDTQFLAEAARVLSPVQLDVYRATMIRLNRANAPKILPKN
jgi:hypothetical protein